MPILRQESSLSDCDFRGQGGYIIAPPSVGSNGMAYTWTDGLALGAAQTAPLPDAIYNALILTLRGDCKGGEYREGEIPMRNKAQHTATKRNISFVQGHRDETLFYLANHLVKGGMPIADIQYLLTLIAFKICAPPFPEKEISEKIQSALKRAEIRERNLSQEIREWVLSTNGHFLSTNVHNGLQLSTRQEKKLCSMFLSRLVDEKTIERIGEKNGCFRRVERDCPVMDLKNASTKPIDIKLLFRMEKMVQVMPGNIVLLAGEKDSGKTAYLLNLARLNMHKFNVSYFNSEMGSGEFKKRLLDFEGMTLDDWKIKPYERSMNFADVVKPGADNLNIVDFMEIHDNFYKIGGLIAEIHRKLDGAICFIAIQKNPNVETGLGGYRSLEKPRLVLNLSKGLLRIFKAKNWASRQNPVNKQIKFNIINGSQLKSKGTWHDAQ